ncbi:hypothetical protein SLK260_08020 [Helicobacter pylori]
MEPFLIVKRGLKFVLIKDSDKDGGLVAWWDRFGFGCKTLQGGILNGIALVLVAKLLRGYFKITFPLITLKKPPLK